MRTSKLTHDECIQQVDIFLNDYRGDVYVERGAADCDKFPCPEELDDWSGQTNAIYVYDVSTGEEVFACAYWE